MKLEAFATASLAMVVVATAALASEGRIEINQASALAGGITASDTPGFPVTIDEAGSYVLTGNLTVADANVTAIEATSEFVTIDLNGFTVSGPVTCSGTGATLSCSPSGTGTGIEGINRVTVVNGTVTGFAADGISLQADARVERVSAMFNRGAGIRLSSGRALAVRNIVRFNIEYGLEVGQDSVVDGNVVNDNKSTGILSGAGCTVVNNSVNRNGGTGIAANSGIVATNTVRSNGGNQISSGGGCLVTGNSVYGPPGSAYGIDLASAWDGYSNNVVAIVDSFGTVDNGTNLGQNVCNDDVTTTTCP